MKSSLKNTTIFAVAMCAAVFISGSAFNTVTHGTQNKIQTVTITAKAMTEAQKLAYDSEQNGIQTVVISAKRLTTEQKIAMDQQDQQNQFKQQSVAEKNNHRTAI